MISSEQRKQELRNKVYKLWVSNGGDDADVDVDVAAASGNLALTEAAIGQCQYLANIGELKQFLVDRDCKGGKPKLIVSAPVTRPGAKAPVDVLFMPNDAKHNPDILDWLKKHELVPEDSATYDYSFILR